MTITMIYSLPSTGMIVDSALPRLAAAPGHAAQYCYVLWEQPRLESPGSSLPATHPGLSCGRSDSAAWGCLPAVPAATSSLTMWCN